MEPAAPVFTIIGTDQHGAPVQEEVELTPARQRFVDALSSMLAARQATRELITASRQYQGAQSRRSTAARALFATCKEVRERVADRWRTPSRAELRRAFGVGTYASADKPGSVVEIARIILEGWEHWKGEAYDARVRAPTIERIRRLQAELVAAEADVVRLRGSRKEVRARHGRPKISPRRRRGPTPGAPPP